MILAVINSKGGVGKSTLAVHAAAWLQRRGYRIAVVDADAQRSTTDWLGQMAPDIRLETHANPDHLIERLPRLAAIHDIVIADGPATLNETTITLAGAADLVLMPIGPSLMDVHASYRTARELYRVRLAVQRDDRPYVVTVMNRVQPRTRLARVALAAVRKYGFPIARSVVQLRQAYAEACGQGTTVWDMGSSARNAARELDHLFSEIFEADDLAAIGFHPRSTQTRETPRTQSRNQHGLITKNAPNAPGQPTRTGTDSIAATAHSPQIKPGTLRKLIDQF